MEQRALISMFVEATSTDEDVARHFLELGEWDIEQSVNLYMGFGGGNNNDESCEIRDPIPAKEEMILNLAEIQEQSDAFENDFHSSSSSGSSRTRRKKVVGAGGGVTITETTKTTVVAKNKNGKNIGAFRNFKDEAEVMSESKTKRKTEKLNDIFRPPLGLLFNGSFEEVFKIFLLSP